MKKTLRKRKEWVKHTFLPKTIKLGYQDIKLSEFEFMDGEQGCYRAEPAEIKIKHGAEGREKLNTVLHELLHACVYCYGLKKDFKDDEEEEKIVNALANGLTELLVRNPELVAFIRESI